MRFINALITTLAFSAAATAMAGEAAVDFRNDQTKPVSDAGAFQCRPVQTTATQQQSYQSGSPHISAGSVGPVSQIGFEKTDNTQEETKSSSSGGTEKQLSGNQGSLSSQDNVSAAITAASKTVKARTSSVVANNDLPGIKTASASAANDEEISPKKLEEVTKDLLSNFGPEGAVRKGGFVDNPATGESAKQQAEAFAIDLWDDAHKFRGNDVAEDLNLYKVDVGGSEVDLTGFDARNKAAKIEKDRADAIAKAKAKAEMQRIGKLFHGHAPPAMLKITSVYGPGMTVKNGKVDEAAAKRVFRCSLTHEQHYIPPKLILLVGAIAKDASGGKNNIKVTLNSGYRSHKLNVMVGGATNSRHTKGQAADIVVSGVSSSRVYQSCVKLRSGGCFRYNGFTHVDVGPVYPQ